MNWATAIVAGIAFLALTRLPMFRRSEAWSATVTPLASIMGSGFLVSAPLLASLVGNFSPLVMCGLLVTAWCIGGAIRFNINNVTRHSADDSRPEDSQGDSPELSPDHRLHLSHADSLLSYIWRETKEFERSVNLVNWLEKASQFVLAIAYLISVTYYIRLLGQFLFQAIGSESELWQDATVVAVLGGISLTGFFFGLKVIERVEKDAINLNLAVIVALLCGLVLYNFQLWQADKWTLPDLAIEKDPWAAFRACLGLLVIVQGFETSRFLGAEHSAPLRVMTMRRAQAISSVIYIVFLASMLVVVTPQSASQDVDVTAIIGLVGVVAGILPAMLTVAALGSQFSAAVADEAGCGGLLSQLVGRFLTDRTAYLFVGAVTIGLAVTIDILQIVSFASRAFAAFYCLQCAIAAVFAWNSQSHSKLLAVWFGFLAVVAGSVTVLATAVEG